MEKSVTKVVQDKINLTGFSLLSKSIWGAGTTFSPKASRFLGSVKRKLIKKTYPINWVPNSGHFAATTTTFQFNRKWNGITQKAHSEIIKSHSRAEGNDFSNPPWHNCWVVLGYTYTRGFTLKVEKIFTATCLEKHNFIFEWKMKLDPLSRNFL